MAESDEQKKSASAKQIHAAIDRIEDDGVAVLYVGDDEKTKIDIPLRLLPDGADAGDHLRITVSIDKGSRDQAASRVKSMQDKLVQKSGTEDQKDFKL